MEVVELKIVSGSSDSNCHVQLLINGSDCGYLYLSGHEYNFMIETFKASEDSLKCAFKYDE